MIILPAIDIIDRKAVRLYQGDYDKMTVYDNDPVNVALAFEAAGAEYIHLVDLDGAKRGEPCSFDIISEIASRTKLSVEVGGGIRDGETVARYIDAGADRVIIGTAAVTDPDFLCAAISLHGDRIAVGADIRDGYVAIRGWTENSSITLSDFSRSMAAAGVRTMIYTDISRDGAMRGPNLSLYRDAADVFPGHIIASGGVSTIADIIALRRAGLYGAIIGKAYYTGAINLSDAISISR